MDIVTETSLAAFWQARAQQYGDKPALIFEDREGRSETVSYAQMQRRIVQTANLFHAFGVTKGDRVVVQLGNCPEFYWAWFGALTLGAVIVPVNNHFKSEEAGFVLADCEPKLVVTHEAHLFDYLRIAPGTPVLVAREPAEIDVPDVHNFNLALEKQSGTLSASVSVAVEDNAEIMYTSGTTSRPKGVVLTHYNLLWAGRYTAWQGALRADDVYLTAMPLWHIDCQCTASMPAFTAGATLVLLEKYSASRFWRQVCCYRATLTECIPMIVRTLMLQPPQSWEKAHQLRDIFYYLSMCDEEMEAFTRRFGVNLLSSYGMTETVVGLIGDRPGDPRRWPSVGRPGFGYQVRITDCQGNPVAAGVTGDLLVKGERGRTLFKEYYRRPDATLAAFTSDGWLVTGDKASMDEDGYIFFVDRRQNLIKRSGENISSTEIENVLVSHPKVIDAAVVGIPDEICDEQVRAFVVVKENETVTEAEIAAFCQRRLARFKVPQQITIQPSLPRNCSGKVMKHVLKDGAGLRTNQENHSDGIETRNAGADLRPV